MNVSCPNCNTTYRVDPAKVPETGVRARCAVCSAVFLVRRDGAAAPVSAAPAAVSAPPGPAPAAATTSPPPAPAPPPPPAPRAPAVPLRGPMPPAMPPGAGVRPPAFRPATPPRPAGAPAGAVPAANPPPPPRPPVRTAPSPAPAASPPAAPAPSLGAPPAPPSAASPPATTTAPPSPARPINPFLTQDPAAKARRLARALISDMVVYHPAKRQEGLRDGTLKQLFDEEIKKSWEEYADQVGKDVADSTPYFREALNEILADGKQLF